MNHLSRFLRALTPVCAVFMAGAAALSSGQTASATTPSFNLTSHSHTTPSLQPHDAFLCVGVTPPASATPSLGGFSTLLGPTKPSSRGFILVAAGDNVFSFEKASYAVNENVPGGVVTLRVLRTGNDTSGPASVDFAISDVSTTVGQDYVNSSGTISFGPGETFRDINITIKDDAIQESTESFKVTLSKPIPADSAALGANSVATVTISDDDSKVQFSQTSATINESVGSVALTVTRSGDTTQPVTVHYSFANGTATEGQDYIGQDGDVTFPANSVDATGAVSQTINVPITDDTLDEVTENFTVTLSVPQGNNNTTIGTNTTETVNITDNDETGIGFDLTSYQVDESAGTISVNVVRTGDVSQSIRVNYRTIDGTAVAGSDYTGYTGPNNQLVFAANQATLPITINITNDTTAENDETFQVRLFGAAFVTPPPGQLPITTNPDSTAVTILDDDPAVNFATTNYSVNEADGTVTITVLRSGPTTGTATVAYSTANGTATNPGDYTSQTGTLTFGPGVTTQSRDIPIVNDLANENTEAFTVTLSNPVNTQLGPDTTTTVTILDDDPIPTITIDDVTAPNADNASLKENDLAVAGGLVFRVKLSAPSGKQVTVNYTTADGSATVADNDYTAKSSPPLTIPIGASSATITVPVTGDSKFEDDEAFILSLTSATNATIERKKATGSILNDDPPPTSYFNFSPVQPSVAENDPNGYVALNITRTGDTTTQASVTFNTADGTAVADSDYSATSKVVIFPIGSTSQIVQVPIFNDTVNEADETFTATLSAPTASPAVALLGGNPTATVTITNDDAAPTLTIGNASVTEGNSGTVNLVFPVSIDGNSEQTLSVQYATADGTGPIDTRATVADNDYVATSGTLTFAPGDRAKTITVVVNGDTTIENNETLSVVLTNPQNLTLSSTSATGTILNDDTPPTISNVSFVQTAVSVNENVVGGKVTLTLKRTTGTDRVATVDYATANGTATAGSDYTATTGTATFAVGATTATITVPIIDDTLQEPGANETFTVTLSNPGGNAVLPTQKTATVSIVDNEGTPTLSVAKTEVLEGDSGSSSLVFTVSLSPQSKSTVKVTATTSDGTAISSGRGQDYRARTAVLTFAPGQSTQPFAVSVIGDTLVEDDETVNVKLSSPQGAPIASNGAAVVGTILNDDQPGGGGTISFLASSYAINENGGSAMITLGRTGKIDLINAQSATVRFVTGTGTATPNQDYRPVNTTVTFPAGETTASVLIPIIDDTIYEGDENVSLAISTPSSNAILGSLTTATLTITDNDPISPLPRADSVTPSTVTGSPFTVTGNYSIDTVAATKTDPGQSVNNLVPVLIQFGGNANGGGFRALYDPSTNFLTIDPGTGLKVRPGAHAVLTNQYGSLDASKTTVQRSGNTLTVTWRISLTSKIALPIYIGATNNTSGQSVFIRRGLWRPAAATAISINGS